MILCGLFCAGKSTIGKALAAHRGLPFYDTDRMLEDIYGQSVSSIWREGGEEAFRDLETACVYSLKKEACIIATGGGTLLRKENRAYLRKIGETIYLKASLTILWERLVKRGLPAYLNIHNPLSQMERLAEERFPIFEDFCDHVMVTEGYSVEQCVIHLDRFFGLQRGESLTEKRSESL